jgi:hypothetical protein
MWLWLVIWFTEYLQIVATINYSAIANSHSLQFAMARPNCSQFAMSSPVFSASVFTFLPADNSITTPVTATSRLSSTTPRLFSSTNWFFNQFVLFTTTITQYGLSRKHTPTAFLFKERGFPSTKRYYSRFDYLLLTSLLHVSVARPSSSRNIYIFLTLY